MIYKNLKEAAALLVGHCGFDEIENVGPVAVRFTPDQLKFYASHSDTDYLRSHSMTGVSLRFATDAAKIGFDYRFVGAYCISSGIDIYEDGVLCENVALKKTEETVSVEYTVKNPGCADIEIHFPHGTVIVPLNLDIGNARPKGSPEKLALFYGDSITQAAYTTTPSLTWTTYVAESIGARELNRGIGSFYFNVDSLPDSTDCIPDWLFIEYGFNDLAKFSDDDYIMEIAEKYLKRINVLYPSAKKYIITTEFGKGAAATDEAFARRHAYCRRLEKLAAELGIRVINGSKLVPTMPVMFAADFVHLSEAGCAVFAHNLVKYMD